jgi:DNA-binding transcriptional ArsR family regulator
MRNGPAIATIASLIGDPARASMLSALMGGHELTATELAREGGVTPQTASGHLARLLDGGLVLAAQRGRHRYFRLASPAIADLLETLMGVAGDAGPSRTRPGPRDEALRRARVCYDHLAGEEGLRLADGMVASGWLASADESFALTIAGRSAFASRGIDMAALEAARRPLCRACLDWSERRPHLGGALGAALLRQFLEAGWLRRLEGSRVLAVTPKGRAGLQGFVDRTERPTTGSA